VTDMAEGGRLWLVWSNEHGQWRAANGVGYTRVLDEAGRYSRDDADGIVDRATLGGTLRITVETRLGQRVEVLPEVAVPAPEAEGAWAGMLRPFAGGPR
jgi:hypothetical protein